MNFLFALRSTLDSLQIGRDWEPCQAGYPKRDQPIAQHHDHRCCLWDTQPVYSTAMRLGTHTKASMAWLRKRTISAALAMTRPRISKVNLRYHVPQNSAIQLNHANEPIMNRNFGILHPVVLIIGSLGFPVEGKVHHGDPKEPDFSRKVRTKL